MSLVRPELRRLAGRFRESLAGLSVGALGLWAALGSGGLLAAIGWVVLALGCALCALGVQRARFRRAGAGPGVVTVTEGQISYFGPLEGGVLAIDNLARVSLDPTGHPLHWVLDQKGGPSLHVPVNASGADALFDAFTRLPGLEIQPMLKDLESPGDAPRVVWARSPLRLG